MRFFTHVASVATVILGLAGLGTPAFALRSAPTPNAVVGASVPVIATVEPVLNPPAFAPTAEIVQQAAVIDEDTEYASLSQAVAAQDMADTGDRDLNCLAGAIYFEAKGEPLSGQLAVAEVIINRAKSGRFANSVCAVVTQPGQFSFVRGGRIPEIADNANHRTARAVARVALADSWDSPAANALFFHARRVSPGWRLTKVAAIGNHIFYR